MTFERWVNIYIITKIKVLTEWIFGINPVSYRWAKLSLQIPGGLQNLALKKFRIVLVIFQKLLDNIKSLLAATFSQECARLVLWEKDIACALYIMQGIESFTDIFHSLFIT